MAGLKAYSNIAVASGVARECERSVGSVGDAGRVAKKRFRASGGIVCARGIV